MTDLTFFTEITAGTDNENKVKTLRTGHSIKLQGGKKHLCW